MIESGIRGNKNDRLTEGEMRRLEDALATLTRMITRSVLRGRLRFARSQDKEQNDSAVCFDRIRAAAKPDEPLTLSVQAAARTLGLSRASTYAAIRAGQIPSIRFGKRIVIPRVAVDTMLSQADSCKSNRV